MIGQFQNDVQSSDIIYESVSLFSSRMSSEVELNNFVSAIEIYEHLEKPYLTGTIALTDTSRIYDRSDFQGAEYLEIKIKRNPQAPSYSKLFNIDEVTSTRKTNDQSEVITLHLTEECGFKSKLHNINKHYSGKPSTIIQNIAKEYLYKEILTSEGLDYQGDISLIVPNMNPIEAMLWVKNRMTNEEGYPFFLYSTFGSRSLFLQNLSDMLSAPAINKSVPYIYSQTPSLVPTNQRFFTIQDYKHVRNENMLKLIDKGLVGGVHNFYNTMTSNYENVEFDAVKEMQASIQSKNSNQKEMNIADNFEIDGERLQNYRSRYIHTIASSGAYTILDGSRNSYDEELTAGAHKKKVINAALKQMMSKSAIQIRVSGREYMRATGSTSEHFTIGNSIRIIFLGNTPQGMSNNKIDPKKTGDYIIFSAKHSMVGERYDVSLLCVKIANVNTADYVGV